MAGQDVAALKRSVLEKFGIAAVNSGASYGPWIETPAGERISSIDPSDGSSIADVLMAAEEDYDEVVHYARQAFDRWRMVPAPKRGLIVREIGEELRSVKNELGALVSIETGKILQEGIGEVQEMIDIADFAVGLSRQLYGLTVPSERPGHRMYELWHPLGVVGVISAFNFPVAVWSWNALIAAVCGDCVVWKPSPETPLTAIAVQHICNRVMARHGWEGVFNLVIGDVPSVGERMLGDRRIPLISATGSCAMGRRVAEVAGRRLARTLLELGGNNGVIVMPDADMKMVVRAVLFGAVGTAGQRCTSIRRLFVHRSVAADLKERLIAAYGQIRIGSPLDPGTLVGPLIHEKAVRRMQDGLRTAVEQGGRVVWGGRTLGGCFVEPAIVEAHPEMPVLQEEIFAPILYLIEFDGLDQAIAWHNGVPQGLSSSIFTTNLLAAETFLSARGSDCGIANVNIGTSGAEIGGAFGGEKDTGGGRESGSDSWKAYMRRQTVTVNGSSDLPLSQGIEFPI
ncbi:MAG TPA: aldehyde dehydrogenase family protein [Bryobacteraceae bacterium]|nr:aldehyde dehydrogenase family protein [Bryobacteraceae bacterium]